MKIQNTSTFPLCLLVLISTATAQNGARKTTLEDIERDYTTSTTTKPKQTTAKVVAPAQSPTLYGFVPIKTIADYARNEPKPLLYSQGRQQYSPYAKQQYQQGQYHRGSSAGTKTSSPQAYTFPLQFDLPPQQRLQTATQYYHQQQYPTTQQYPAAQQYTTPKQQYTAPQESSSQENAYTFPLQFDLPYSQPQQHSQPATQYYHQQQYPTTQQYPATQQYTTPRQQYTVPQEVSYQKNVQYVTDNSLAAQQYPKNVQYVTDNNIGSQQQPQYYSPQYVYLQQDPAPSTSVQTFVDPKGGVQYIMFIPQSAITTTSDQPQKYENLAYATEGEADNQRYAPVQYDSQKEQEAPAGQQYVYRYEQKEEKAPAAGVQYVVQPQYEQKEQQVQYVHPKQQYAKPSEYIIKREPKSLLDSYIPSVVQLEYYRQIQQNAIRDSVKVPQVFNKRQEYTSQSSTTEDATPDVSRQYVTKYVPQSSTKRYSYRG